MIRLVDTHCHLDFDAFNGERDKVIENAREHGVVRILNPGIDLKSSRMAVRLAERYECVYAAVGVHPNSALSWDQDTRRQLADLARHPKVIGVGEIGLDYYRDHAPRALQREVLAQQLSLAAELELPVVLHNRQATTDLLAVLTGWCVDLVKSGSEIRLKPGVLHSFSDSLEEAGQAQNLGFFIGITGPVTFKNAGDLRDTVIGLPQDHILIETDAPFLAPHPLRGKRNEPANVRFVAQKIAEIQSQSPEAFARQTYLNAERLFGW